jgi:hypothetical protein
MPCVQNLQRAAVGLRRAKATRSGCRGRFPRGPGSGRATREYLRMMRIYIDTSALLAILNPTIEVHTCLHGSCGTSLLDTGSDAYLLQLCAGGYSGFGAAADGAGSSSNTRERHTSCAAGGVGRRDRTLGRGTAAAELGASTSELGGLCELRTDEAIRIARGVCVRHPFCRTGLCMPTRGGTASELVGECKVESNYSPPLPRRISRIACRCSS